MVGPSSARVGKKTQCSTVKIREAEREGFSDRVGHLGFASVLYYNIQIFGSCDPLVFAVGMAVSARVHERPGTTTKDSTKSELNFGSL